MTKENETEFEYKNDSGTFKGIIGKPVVGEWIFTNLELNDIPYMFDIGVEVVEDNLKIFAIPVFTRMAWLDIGVLNIFAKMAHEYLLSVKEIERDPKKVSTQKDKKESEKEDGKK